MNTNIINHGGVTRLLQTAVEENGRTYAFLFHAAAPEEKRWAYRLLEPDTPAQLTEEQLTAWLRARPSLRADWEEQVGHPVGLITVYLPREDGQVEGTQARFEQGPELDRGLKPPKAPEPERDIRPERDIDDFGPSF